MSLASNLPNLLVAFALAALISWTAWRWGALKPSGALAASLLGGLLYGLGGLPWAILVLAFFVSSSLLSRAFGKDKRDLQAVFEKGGQRDWGQVAANGGAGTAFLLMAMFSAWPPEWAWLAFSAAMATVTADTWATELGVLSSRPPRLITTGRVVARGTSGGITLLGTLASLLGAAFIAVAAWVLASASFGGAFVLLIVLVGTAGALIDSLMGASVQAIYYCPQCERETERHPLHSCGTPTRAMRGWGWLNNDWVNFISSVLGALLALAAGLNFGLVG